jgi:hypothetical protein
MALSQRSFWCFPRSMASYAANYYFVLGEGITGSERKKVISQPIFKQSPISGSLTPIAFKALTDFSSISNAAIDRRGICGAGNFVANG